MAHPNCCRRASLPRIGDDADVDAKGLGTGVSSVLTGEVVSDGNFSAAEASGVIVQARSSETLLNLAFAGGGGLVGVAGAVSVTVVDSDTYAVIGENAQINMAGASYLTN